MKARVRDTEIYFDIDGAALVRDGGRMREKPVAFIIHGGPGVDHIMLKDAFGAFANKLQLIYFDQRGHGRSGRGDDRRYTLDENVEDMEALRQYLGLGPIVSLGSSYGGMVAMAHAARHPAAVSHLILNATAAHCGFIARSRKTVRERGTPEQVRLSEEALLGHMDTVEKFEHYLDVMGPLYSGSNKTSPWESRLQLCTLSPLAYNETLGRDGFLHDFDLRPELPAIKVPTLILAGRHDWICPPEFSEEMQRLIPGSQLRIFEHSGHSIRTDEPEQFLDVIAGFLVYNQGRPVADTSESGANSAKTDR